MKRPDTLRRDLVASICAQAERGVQGGSCYALEDAINKVLDEERMYRGVVLDNLVEEYNDLFAPRDYCGKETCGALWGGAWGMPFNEEDAMVAAFEGYGGDAPNYFVTADCRATALALFAAMLDAGEFDHHLHPL